MSDTKGVNESNTPEEVAFKLLREVANAEGKKVIYGVGNAMPDRKWLLDTYAECLIAVRAPSNRLDRE